MSISDLKNNFFEKVESLDLNQNVCNDVAYHFENMINSANFHSLCVTHGYIVAVFRTLCYVDSIGVSDFSELHSLLEEIFGAVYKGNGLAIR